MTEAELMLEAEAVSGVGSFGFCGATQRLHWSAQACRLHGHVPGPAVLPLDQALTLLDGAEGLRVGAALRDALQRQATGSIDYDLPPGAHGHAQRLRCRYAPAAQRGGWLVGSVQALHAATGGTGELAAHDALLALDISATQVGFGFGWRDALSDVGQWSPQLKRMLGLPEHAPTPSREQFLAQVVPADRERVARELVAGPPMGAVQVFEYEVGLPDGTRRTLMTRAVVRPDTSGRPWRYYFVAIDITESRARDRQVIQLAQRLQLASEASGVGTWDRDMADTRSHWDATTKALFGLPPEGPTPTFDEFLAMVHPDDRAHVVAEVATQKSLVEYEYRVTRPDGCVRWMVTRGRAQRDADGRVLSRTGICLDVTERHEAQAALHAKELAERANAAKTEFLSRMSHELRTPLNAVLGFAQVMALDTAEPLSDSQRARIGHIQTAGWHLLALINDVLDLARIESRQSALNPALVPLAEVVAECLVMNAAAAAAQGIEQRLAPPQPGLQDGWDHAWADRTRVRQVLLNLLSNAVKYNRPGGHVRVAVAAAAAGMLAVSVADDGPGLSVLQLQHLFEPFNRLGHENGPVEGTGIGLTLSRLIAQQMGGDISVDSGPGRGSEFRLLLPAAPLR